jgi:hypothetical protein
VVVVGFWVVVVVVVVVAVVGFWVVVVVSVVRLSEVVVGVEVGIVVAGVVIGGALWATSRGVGSKKRSVFGITNPSLLPVGMVSFIGTG